MRLALALAIVAVAAGAARADRPALQGAEMAVAAWLDAPHQTPPSIDDAVAMTELPFAWAGSTACAKKSGTAVDATGARDVIPCLAKDAAPFLAADATFALADPAKLPRPLTKQAKQLAALAKTHTLVLAHGKAGKRDAWAVLAVSYDPSAKAAAIAAFVQAR